MFERLLEYANALEDDGHTGLFLQDVALCGAWYESYDGNATILRPYNRLPRLIEAWTAHITAQQLNTEGRRHQWLLRDEIDALQDGRLPHMERDELDFIAAVFAIGRRVADPQVFRRVLELLHPFVEDLRTRRETLALLPGMPNVSKMNNVINSADIKRARSRQVGSVAGIAMPGRGPILGARGHVKVLDDVPDNCTLVVENGSCSVEGFVFGRVAVHHDCDVRENI